MILYKNRLLWISYDPKKKFERELYKYWNNNIEFCLIENKLLIHLYESDKNYFTLPSSKSKTKSNVYFLFDITTDVPNTRVEHQRYNFKKSLLINPEEIGLSN